MSHFDFEVPEYGSGSRAYVLQFQECGRLHHLGRQRNGD